MNKKDINILNVPTLRFKEFTGEWIKKTFDESVDHKKGRGLSRDSITESGSECILYGDLYTIYKDNPIIKNARNVTNIDGDYILSKENDVVVPSSGENALDISSAGCVKKSGIILGGDLNILTPKDEIYGDFLAYQIRGARKIDIAKVSQGISVVHLNYPQLSKVNFHFPKFDEQIKIAQLLNLVNLQIEAQSKLINNYESLMSEIFDCSEKKSKYILKDLVTFEKKNGRMSSEGRGSGKFAFYTNERKQHKYIDDYDFNGEYIIANTGGQANFKYVKGAFAVMSDSLVMKVKEASTPAVFYSLLSMTQYINNVGFAGSGLKHLDKKWFLNLIIDIPNKKTIDMLEKIEHSLQILKNFESSFSTFKIYLLDALFV